MNEFPQLNNNNTGLGAIIKTTKGDMTVRLFPEQVPKTLRIL